MDQERTNEIPLLPTDESSKTLKLEQSENPNNATFPDSKLNPEQETPLVEDETEDQTNRPKNHVQDQSIKLAPTQLALVFGGLCLTTLLGSMDMTIVATALPVIASDLQDVSLLPWVATAYMITTTGFQPLYGRCSDIFGRRSMIAFAIVVFLLSTVWCALAPNMIQLIVARGFQGIGGAGLLGMSQVVLVDILPLRERGKYQGILGSVWAVSSIVGPLLGGVPIGALAFFMVVSFLNLPRVKGDMMQKFRRVDFIGSFFLLSFCLLLQLGLNFGGSRYPWSSYQVLVPLLLAVVVVVPVFLYIETLVAMPILPPDFWKNRNVIGVLGAAFGQGIALYGTIYYCPIFFEVVQGSTATSSGLKLIPLMLPVSIVQTLVGFYISSTGIYVPIIRIGTALSCIAVGLIALFDLNTSSGEQIGILLFNGVSLGLVINTVMLCGQANVPYSHLGAVTSCFQFFRSIGGSVGIAIMGAILNNKLRSNIIASGLPESVVQTAQNSIGAIKNLPAGDQGLVIAAYSDALRLVWIIACAFAGISFIFSLILYHVPLKTTMGKKSDKELTDAVEERKKAQQNSA
ncbi:hypothetical protein SmJEL517_g03600 [Synchytrium microbalum]|uniref:Major facilitator superfamily (MFS) profile domain-containing protein n=1 Tax=Synchytrium microbalum TaxID=1806994 RepID=A0A507C7D4_9FUNG|nr:uncharacterized protein SmJEL517_g03600 [Synchytrium microbalum]TPX33443.1 hypothetical protein SmJEL517_g03600 [Synchytrium microbalum]